MATGIAGLEPATYALEERCSGSTELYSTRILVEGIEPINISVKSRLPYHLATLVYDSGVN